MWPHMNIRVSTKLWIAVNVLLALICEPAYGDVASDKAAARDLFKRGEVAIKQGRDDQAVKLIEQGIKLDNSYAGAYLNLANAYLGLNKPKTAEQVARTAIKMAPARFSSHFILALALRDQQKYAEAREVLKRASRLTKTPTQQEFLDQELAELARY